MIKKVFSKLYAAIIGVLSLIISILLIRNKNEKISTQNDKIISLENEKKKLMSTAEIDKKINRVTRKKNDKTSSHNE